MTSDKSYAVEQRLNDLISSLPVLIGAPTCSALAGNQTFNSVTQTGIGTMSFALPGAGTYRMHGMFETQASGNGYAQAIQLTYSGGLASPAGLIKVSFSPVNPPAQAAPATSRITPNGGPVSSYAQVSGQGTIIEIGGTLYASSGGTFNVEAATTGASVPFTMFAGSYFEVWQPAILQ